MLALDVAVVQQMTMAQEVSLEYVLRELNKSRGVHSSAEGLQCQGRQFPSKTYGAF